MFNLKKFRYLAALALLLVLIGSTTPSYAGGIDDMVGSDANKPAMIADVGCSGHGCDGKDPVQMGCANDATTVAQRSYYNVSGEFIVKVELRWSNTCKTNWAKASYWTSVYQPTVELWSPNPSGTRRQTYTYPGYTQYTYGDMYYAPSESISACVTNVPNNGDRFCTNLV